MMADTLQAEDGSDLLAESGGALAAESYSVAFTGSGLIVQGYGSVFVVSQGFHATILTAWPDPFAARSVLAVASTAAAAGSLAAESGDVLLAESGDVLTTELGGSASISYPSPFAATSRLRGS